jgi:hypothetical protein
MARLSESVLVSASLKETWDFYFDPKAWGAWVDGFQAVEESDGYPEEGGALVWRSTPAGRGTVRERVLAHSPRTLHRIAFEDPQSAGELETRFSVEGDGARVTLALEYRIAAGGPFSRLTDRLFVRGQVRRSLQRTLMRLKHEAEEWAHFADQDPRPSR